MQRQEDMACSQLVALGGILKCCTEDPVLKAYDTCTFDKTPSLSMDMETRTIVARQSLDGTGDNDEEVGTFYDLTVARLDGVDYCPYSFSTTLEHHPIHGMPRCDDVRVVLAAAACPSNVSLAAIPRAPGAQRRLEGLVDATNMLGFGARVGDSLVDASLVRFASSSSDRMAYDLAKLYGMAHLRECPLDRLSTACSSKTQRVLNFLNTFPQGAAANLTTETLYRCTYSGCRSGPYISQLLYRPYYEGAIPRTRRFSYEIPGVDLIDRDALLSLHNGNTRSRLYATAPSSSQRDLKYLYNGQTLGSAVHSEPVYQHYYEAALAYVGLFTARGRNFEDGFRDAHVTSSTTAGYDDILTSVAAVCTQALRQSYAEKWLRGAKIRPDAFAMRVDTFRRASAFNLSTGDIPGADTIVDHFFADAGRRSFMEEVVGAANQNRSGTASYLLDALYESPAHPSWTHGHAVVAGAAVTVLKAMLVTTDDAGNALSWDAEVLLPNSDGSMLDTLADYGETAGMTYEGELNKLAYNVAVGRNWAGLHFDTELDYSMALGETVAIAFLKAKVCEYHVARRDSFHGWTFHALNGTTMRIKTCDDAIRASDDDIVPPPAPPPVSSVAFGSHDVKGTSENFRRLTPKPMIGMQRTSPIAADRIDIVQRQMAFGDASIRRATLTITKSDATRIVRTVHFGTPNIAGTNGTLLTNLSQDAFGRHGSPRALSVLLDGITSIRAIEFVVDEIYDLTWPPSIDECDMLCADDDVFAYMQYARFGSWNVGLTHLAFYDDGALVSNYHTDGTTTTFSSNGHYDGDAFRPANPFVNPYGVQVDVNPLGFDVVRSWCWYGEQVLAGNQPQFVLASDTLSIAAFGVNDVPGVPENFIFLTPKPRLSLAHAAPGLSATSVEFTQRQMAFGDATMKRALLTINDEYTFDVAFGEPSVDGSTGTLWQDLSGDQYGRNGNPSPVAVSFGETLAITSMHVDVLEVYPFVPPPEGTEGSTGDCGGLTGTTGGTKDRFGVYVRYGSWNVGFVRIEFKLSGVTVDDYLAQANVTANGFYPEPDAQPINPFRNVYDLREEDDNGLNCNNFVHSWNWFGTTVLKGDRPEFGYIDTPDILTEAELLAQPNRTIPIFGEDGGGEPTR